MTFNKTKILLCAPMLVLLWSASPADNAADYEIEYLLQQVGDSNCAFLRNGDKHSAADAEDHLRMKLRKGRRHVDSAEKFITRIASASSWSGQAYQLKCGEKESEFTRDWLAALLQEYRSN
jgi:hypothetical protein